MFLLYGDDLVTACKPVSYRGDYADPLAVVIDGEKYDAATIVVNNEIIASWCSSNGWWLRCEDEECAVDQYAVWEMLVSIHRYYDNSI